MSHSLENNPGQPEFGEELTVLPHIYESRPHKRVPSHVLKEALAENSTSLDPDREQFCEEARAELAYRKDPKIAPPSSKEEAWGHFTPSSPYISHAARTTPRYPVVETISDILDGPDMPRRPFYHPEIWATAVGLDRQKEEVGRRIIDGEPCDGDLERLIRLEESRRDIEEEWASYRTGMKRCVARYAAIAAAAGTALFFMWPTEFGASSEEEWRGDTAGRDVLGQYYELNPEYNDKRSHPEEVIVLEPIPPKEEQAYDY